MIMINRNEYENEFKKYEYLNENENESKIKIFNSNNNHNNSVTYEIINRLIFNAYELHKPIIYNLDILKEIINEYIEINSENENESVIKIYHEIQDAIIELIDENASDYYFRNKYNKASKYEYTEYIKAFKDSYSIYDLLSLFDEITDEFKSNYNLYKGSINDYLYSNSSCHDLISYIISELDNKLKLNLNEFKIALNISDSVITENNMICFNNEFIDSEISNNLLNDLYESILYDLYESEIIDVMFYDEIDLYEITESNLIEMYNSDYTSDLKYINKSCLIYSINDLMKLNEIISESDEYEMKFKPENISELFKNSNNTLDENFLYAFYDIFSESLYSDYYESYYYELYKINSSGYKFKKVTDIYELIKIVLNEFKHYNLNNSFKFKPELYEL